MTTLAVLTSGGDAPGMNAAVRAAALVSWSRGWRVLGVRHGFRGLLEDGEIQPLERRDVQGIFRRGGTVLGSARCPEMHEPDARRRARRRLADHDVEALLVIGGNGSIAGARALADPAEAGSGSVRVLGIPASIDNDIGGTSMAIGVDTATNTIVEACDRIQDTAAAHDRTFIVEVMGRQCGYLAQVAGIAAGADLVLFPESHRDPEELVSRVAEVVVRSRGDGAARQSVLVIKAEGVELPSAELARRVDERVRAEHPEAHVETRVTILGHVVRGGSPTAFDRLLASRLGHAAAHAAIEGASSVLIAWQPSEPERVRAARCETDPSCWAVPIDEALAETERRERGDSARLRWRTEVFDQLEGILSTTR